MPNEIYLDNNATTPVLPIAAASAQHVMETLFGNPSSSHYAGLKAREMMANVRARAARVLGAGSGSIVFVSGATEALQTAVLSALCAWRHRRDSGEAPGRLVLYGATEHKAVPESLAHWNQVLGLGLDIRALPVDGDGQHDLETLRRLAPEAALVCTMAANNETGVVSDIAGIASVLEHTASRALWLVDGVQALGKLPLQLAATRIDYAAFSGHKLYAPKGVGMLYVRAQAPFTALMAGGGQEAGQRSGTENMAGIAALGAVLQALEEGQTFRTHAELQQMRERLVENLRTALPGLVFNAPLDKTLPTTLNFSVPGFSSKELLDLFDAAGIRVSSGSACSAAKAMPSYVLEAMGLPAWRAASAVRMSFGPATDPAFIAQACARIADCGSALRASGLTGAAQDTPVKDGVQQFSVDGLSSWLVLDAASRRCIVIDPLPQLADRLATSIRSRDLQVLAILDRARGPESASGRARLIEVLGPHFRPDAGTDSSGWPAGASWVELADGGRAQALRLGASWLVRQPMDRETSVYLLGTSVDGRLPSDAVDFIFSGRSLAPAMEPAGACAGPRPDLERLAGLVHPATVLCTSGDADEPIASTFQAALLAPPANQEDAGGEGMHLRAKALEAFLAEHANAVLVDVREPFEHLVSPAPSWLGRTPQQVPLSRLVNHLGGWLRDTERPLVFICRSGARSARTAACLRRLGHRKTWHLAGGLANV